MRLPIEDGMFPLKSLAVKSNRSRFIRFPNVEGRLPCNLLKTKFTPVTLAFVTTTPYHVDTGFFVNQRVCTLQLGPPVLLYKSTSAKESCTFTCALTMLMLQKRANTRRKIVEVV